MAYTNVLLEIRKMFCKIKKTEKLTGTYNTIRYTSYFSLTFIETHTTSAIT